MLGSKSVFKISAGLFLSLFLFVNSAMAWVWLIPLAANAARTAVVSAVKSPFVINAARTYLTFGVVGKTAMGNSVRLSLAAHAGLLAWLAAKGYQSTTSTTLTYMSDVAPNINGTNYIQGDAQNCMTQVDQYWRSTGRWPSTPFPAYDPAVQNYSATYTSGTSSWNTYCNYAGSSTVTKSELDVYLAQIEANPDPNVATEQVRQDLVQLSTQDPVTFDAVVDASGDANTGIGQVVTSDGLTHGVVIGSSGQPLVDGSAAVQGVDPNTNREAAWWTDANGVQHQLTLSDNGNLNVDGNPVTPAGMYQGYNGASTSTQTTTTTDPAGNTLTTTKTTSLDAYGSQQVTTTVTDQTGAVVSQTTSTGSATPPPSAADVAAYQDMQAAQASAQTGVQGTLGNLLSPLGGNANDAPPTFVMHDPSGNVFYSSNLVAESDATGLWPTVQLVTGFFGVLISIFMVVGFLGGNRV